MIYKERYTILAGVFIALVMFVYFSIFDIDMMSHTWSYPFFSGATSIFDTGQWLINTQQLHDFYQLQQQEIKSFNFVYSADNSQPYTYNAIGYVYIVAIAGVVFPFLTLPKAVILLQVVVHFLISLYVFQAIKKPWLQLLFVALYAVNPIVLKFVFFAFYYYWQCLAAVIFVFIYMKDKVSLTALVFCFVALLALYFVRPTILFLALFSLILAAYKYEKKRWHCVFVFLTFICALFVLRTGVNQGPWHTLYVGLGAYGGIDGIELSDNSGYVTYEKITGVAINNLLPDGNFYEQDFRQHYYTTLEQQSLAVINTHFSKVLSNAVKNILASYSVGYFVGKPILQWGAVISGFVLMGLLLWYRFYVLFLAIGFSSSAFALYYPPIPAYMYGSYLLIVVGSLGVLHQLIYKRKNESTLFRSR